jgi:hypothetical protein
MGRGETKTLIDFDVQRFGLDTPIFDEAQALRRFEQKAGNLNRLIQDRLDFDDAIEAAIAAGRDVIHLEADMNECFEKLGEALLFYDREHPVWKYDQSSFLREQLRYLTRANSNGSPLICNMGLDSDPPHLRTNSTILKTICGRSITNFWKIGAASSKNFCGRCYEQAIRSHPAAAAVARAAFSEASKTEEEISGVTDPQTLKARKLVGKACKNFLEELPQGELTTSAYLGKDELWLSLIRQSAKEGAVVIESLPLAARIDALFSSYKFANGFNRDTIDKIRYDLLEKTNGKPNWPETGKMAELMSAAAFEGCKRYDWVLPDERIESYFLSSLAKELSL